MKTLSVDLRERILASYDAHEGTREEVADRSRVSLGMVKKLLQQRRNTGDIRPRHHYSGRKPKILDRHRRRLRQLLSRQPDLTLTELRGATALTCSLPAIHYALAAIMMMFVTSRRNQEMQMAKVGPVRWRMPRLAAIFAPGEQFITLLGRELTPEITQLGHGSILTKPHECGTPNIPLYSNRWC